MTRIALCYSGRPRSYQECHENHKQNFRLGQNDVDVFAHMWFDEDLVGSQFRTDVGQGTWPDAGVKEWIDENWKPKKIKYEKPILCRYVQRYLANEMGSKSSKGQSDFYVLWY